MDRERARLEEVQRGLRQLRRRLMKLEQRLDRWDRGLAIPSCFSLFSSGTRATPRHRTLSQLDGEFE